MESIPRQCLQQIKTAHFKEKVTKRVPTACCNITCMLGKQKVPDETDERPDDETRDGKSEQLAFCVKEGAVKERFMAQILMLHLLQLRNYW